MPKAQQGFIEIFLRVRLTALHTLRSNSTAYCVLAYVPSLPGMTPSACSVFASPEADDAYPCPQPTLMSFAQVTPDFTNMALAHLEVTISNWKQLEAEGFTM